MVHLLEPCWRHIFKSEQGSKETSLIIMSGLEIEKEVSGFMQAKGKEACPTVSKY